MSRTVDHKRRRFCGACATTAALATGLPRLLHAAGRTVTGHARVALMSSPSTPLRARELQQGVNYIFHYPYACTPCFLLDLGRPLTEPVELETRDDRSYTWKGGVGPGHSIVAFSAICAHRMTHPSPEASFISYHGPGHHAPEERGVIHCCSEDSIYDPAAGARVLSGPAPEPLAAIELEYDPDDDTLSATGVTGGAMFERFLASFGERLAIEYGQDYEQPIGGEAEVVTLEAYTRVRTEC